MSTSYVDPSIRLPSTSARWASPEFRNELLAWVTPVVGEPRSLEPVRLRPWSTVWRVDTDGGTWFAKQNMPLQAFEAGLLVELAELDPGRVVPVTAADPARDLLLTPDQGVELGEALGEAGEEAYVALVGRVVAEAALLQRSVADHADRLAEVGVVRLAPADAPAYVERRLGELRALPAGDPRALSSEQAAAVEACLPDLPHVVEQVASLGLPSTLLYNDLHLWNVFEVDGQLRFFDFGDALLSEPLGALMIPLRGLAAQLDCPEDDPRVRRAAEPALEVWSDLVPVSSLRTALPSALRLARLARTESWLRSFATMTDEELMEWGDAAAYWLAEVAND